MHFSKIAFVALSLAVASRTVGDKKIVTIYRVAADPIAVFSNSAEFSSVQHCSMTRLL